MTHERKSLKEKKTNIISLERIYLPSEGDTLKHAP